MASNRQNQMLESGARAPEFELPGLDNQKRSLRKIASERPALIAFFKTTCPVCQLAFPFLERIHRGQKTPAISIYGVSQDDAETTREFNQEFGVSFPVLLDSEESGYPASNDYRISHVPSVFLVEPDGKISWTMEGFDQKALESLAARAGTTVFRPADKVPAFKPG